MNKKNTKGQMGMGYVMAIIMVVVSVVVLVALWPTISDSFDGLKGSDELNCRSTSDVCGGVGSNDTSICYNSTAGNEHKMTCSFVGITPALIFIFLILGLIGIAIKGGQPSVQQPQYPGY